MFKNCPRLLQLGNIAKIWIRIFEIGSWVRCARSSRLRQQLQCLIICLSCSPHGFTNFKNFRILDYVISFLMLFSSKQTRLKFFMFIVDNNKNTYVTSSSFYQILVYTQVYSAGRYIVTASRTGRLNSFSNISQLQVLASQINSQKYCSCCKITPSPVNVGRATAPPQTIEFGRSETVRKKNIFYL